MRDFNEVKLMGNVANDLKHRTTPWGSSEYHCRMAVDNSYKNKKTNQWVNRSTFLNVKLVPNDSPVDAAIIEKIQKGSKLFVSGKINHREYEKDGQQQTWFEIEARQFELMATHQFENATDQGQLEQQRRSENSLTINGEQQDYSNAKILQDKEPVKISTILSSDKDADTIAKELGNAIAPQDGVGDLDDEIPF